MVFINWVISQFTKYPLNDDTNKPKDIIIAKLSPSLNSNFSWGLTWLYSQIIQPPTRLPTRPPTQPPTHMSLILNLYSNDLLSKVAGIYK